MLASLLVFACADHDAPGPALPSDTVVAEPSAPSLRLEHEGTRGDLIDVQIVYDRASSEGGPRMADLHLSLTGGLTFVAARAGDAALAADKDLVTQTPMPGELRFVIFASDNLARLDSGTLVHLVLRRSRPGTIELLRDAPLFAPFEAEQFLEVDASLSL